MSRSAVLVCAVWLLLIGLHHESHVAAQVRITATPVPAVLPQATVLPTEIAIATPTATLTPTEEGPVMIRALEPVAGTTTNIRILPEPVADVVGSLEGGEMFRVTGRYYSWLQFEFDDVPGDRAWVFEQLVEIVGDGATIPNIDPYAEPTATPLNPGDLPDEVITLTVEQLTLTPGAVETLRSQVSERVVDLTPDDTGSTSVPETLPTYTAPADVAQRPTAISVSVVEPTPDVLVETLSTLVSGRTPPIVPVLLLGGAGSIGLLISLLKR